MESRTEGLNLEVTSRPEAVHSGSTQHHRWHHSSITGKVRKNTLQEPLFSRRKMLQDTKPGSWKNSMVMSWLINSMTNGIGENFMYYGTAKEIWDAARETYSNIDNTSANFEIKSILQDLRQGDSTVTEYFNILTRKESRQKVMLGTQNSSKNLENSALVARGTQSNNNNHQTKKNRPWCDHCRKPGHTKETCWHLHGKPADWKPSRPQQNREGRGYTAAAEENTSGTSSNPGPFSKEQLEALQKMVQQTLQSIGTTIGSASVAQKGASDHMTGNLMVFHEYTPCHNNSSVRIADGTLSRVFGTEWHRISKLMHDTPQQNGVAERKTRHLMEVARSLMIASNVPKQLWGEVVLTTTYLINRMPSRILQFKTLCQILLATYPSARIISSIPIKVFGCTAFVHIHKSQRSKLDPTATKCIFLGYSPNQKGYKCYSPTTKKFYTSMDVTFFENQPFYPKTAIQGDNWSTDEFQFWETEISTTSPLSSSLPPQTDTTLSVPENNSLDEKPEKPPQKEPENSTPPEQNQELDQDPSNPNSQPGNIIYDLNSSNDLDDLDQPIALRKGVRSCTQHPISNHVTYGKLSQNFQAFITSLEDDRIPSNIQEALQQPEWKTAVQEEIQALEKNGTWEISELPEGKRPAGCKWIFTVKHNPDGSINRFKARLVAKGFTQSYGIDYEETFAPVAKLNSIRVLLSVAVNLDWNLHQLDVKNAFLNGELEEEVYMKIPPSMETPENSGKLAELRRELWSRKRKYVLDLLQETGMLGCKPVDTPMDPIGKTDKDNDSHPTDKDKYQRLVGKLIYLTHTRPDIGFAVSMSPGRGLYFKKTSSREVEVFTDADWAGSLTDRRSTTGYCSYMWGNLVTWRSKKQSVVARSSAEAKFKAMAHGICEGTWLQRILKELGIISNSTMTVLCDNKATISIAKNPVQHDRTKHVEIDRHFIKEKLKGEQSDLCIFLQVVNSRHSNKGTSKGHLRKHEKQVGNARHLLPNLRGSVEIWDYDL
ncbi:Retrovirus-related Pol polyprotein from transposon TNT 1-94 [Vitis vinifera]|uniref:Retrovirus-related Pol polyprotein from transposon TNT 1-94 n=1 Tax=Vitis vinifera TaxID=29760 RepID=A0A438DIG7_VITVI|nr:Retrovirus-related Pol polyprotein from transposon TNT 1-94 [Vitis vinifera]